MSEHRFEKELPPGVHVILGDSAAGIFRRVFHPGDQLLVERDVLSCGPTPHCDDIGRWCQMREEFWNSVAPGSASQPEGAGLGLAGEVEQLRAAEQVTLWAATGVNEQLFIAHALHRAEQVGVPASKIQLVQFETVGSSDAPVLGTGMLNEQRMSEHPQPAPLSAAALAHYRAAWAALTSPDPALIERFGEQHPDANEWLERAIERLLRRFPDRRSGLPWWDFTLLTHVDSRGPRAARVIGYAMVHRVEDGDFVGDWYLFGRLLRLGDPRLPVPLLELSGDPSKMREVQVALTPFGRDVLAGRVSSYPANPIDDWASGVRLSSAQGGLWFNDGGRLVRGA